MSNQSEVLARTGGRSLGAIIYSADTIARRVAELGGEITAYYPSGELLLLGLLKGSFVFLPDLVRCVRRPLQVDFLVASSYGSGTQSSGRVELLYDPETELRGKHILLIDDIVDSGNTLERLERVLTEREPLSLNACTLLRKAAARTSSLVPRFVGFEAPDEFVVGYGLDHAEDFRHLPFIASIQG